MIKVTTLVGLLFLSVLVFTVFQVEQHVQSLRSEFSKINKQIIADREAMHVLRAEWTYLNQPKRLSEMAAKYLELERINPAQVRDIEEISISPYIVGNYSESGTKFVNVNAVLTER